MKVIVIQFPGSNCDWDIYHALEHFSELTVEMIWHKEKSLNGADAVILPGGFSFGDYLRCGAIARFSPIMKALNSFAQDGGRVLGICNGFQILCEANLLPGSLVGNDCLQFRCQSCQLTVENVDGSFNRSSLGESLDLPIAHAKGKYYIDPEGLSVLEKQHQILFRYGGQTGNPNGSIGDIAGIRNVKGNIFGMMPHPERAVETYHPSEDGLRVLKAFLN